MPPNNGNQKRNSKETELDEVVKELFTEKERNILENKIHSLGTLQKYATKAGDPQKAEHWLHEEYTFFIGSFLVTTGFLYDKVFLTFYVIGMMMLFGWSAKMFPDDTKVVKLVRNHPLWYIAAGLIWTLLFVSRGYPIPAIDLSLTELVVTSLLGL